MSSVRILEFLRDVSCKTEIRVLVDRARNKAGDVGDRAIYLWEGVGEGRSSLDGSEMDSTDVIRVGKPESSLGLAVSDLPGDF